MEVTKHLDAIVTIGNLYSSKAFVVEYLPSNSLPEQNQAIS